MLWLLVSGSISSGLVPGVEAGGRPSRHMLVRLRRSSGGAPSWGRPAPPRTSPAHQGACVPTPSKTAKGPCPHPPRHKHSLPGGGAREPHQPGVRAPVPSSAFPGPYPGGGAPASQHSGPAFLRSLPLSPQLTRPAQAPLLSRLLPCLALGGGHRRPLPPTHLPAHPSVLGLAFMST